MRTILLALGVLTAGLAAGPAAATGPVIITQDKAIAGGVGPGDAPDFPVTITKPGSYRLGSNLTVPKDKTGIEVSTSDVTIDLDGFRITGGPAGGVDNAFFGVHGTGDRLTVRNGTFTGFRAAGIEVTERLYLVVEDVRLINNQIGLNNFRGNFTRVTNSIASLNSARGITCGDSCQVEGSVISNNGGNGIVITSGTVLGNTLIGNTARAISALTTSNSLVGYGNNTIFNNNGGAAPNFGRLRPLQPNACWPTAC